MRLTYVLPLALAAAAVASPVAAQRARAGVLAPRALALATEQDPYAAIGVTTSASASARDTLGLLVTSVVSDSPAERAGIQEGNRIASVNGVSLRLDDEDIGAPEMGGIMQRRLTREVRKVKPGERVELEVYADGRTRRVSVTTASSDDIYRKSDRTRRDDDDRASLGFGIATTGSMRDTLGVLVMFVNDSGPAARAGMEEGNRIASINGVDVRVSREDAGDPAVASIEARRLQRELAKVKPGDNVDLRVYRDGEYHTVRLRAVRAADLPRSRRSVWIMGDGAGPMPPIPPIPPMPEMMEFHASPRHFMEIDGARIGDDVRRAIERAMDAAGESMQGLGRALDDMGRGFDRTRIRWNDDDVDDARARRQAPSAGTTRARSAPRSAYRSAAAPTTDVLFVPAVASTWESTPVAVPAAVAAPLPPMDASAPVAVIASDGETMSFAGLKLAVVDRELASYLGAGSERGLLVVSVPEWASALRAGDVLLTIDGMPVRRGDEAMIELRADARVELLRKGARRTVTLSAPR